MLDRGTRRRHLANTTDGSMRGSGVAVFQITSKSKILISLRLHYLPGTPTANYFSDLFTKIDSAV